MASITAPPGLSALDQLQNEANLVIEQIGRFLFSVTVTNSKDVATAHAAKLQHMLPDNIERFHENLNQLDDELQLAKLIMRRQLAVARNPKPLASITTDRGDGLASEQKTTDGDVEMADSGPIAEVAAPAVLQLATQADALKSSTDTDQNDRLDTARTASFDSLFGGRTGDRSVSGSEDTMPQTVEASAAPASTGGNERPVPPTSTNIDQKRLTSFPNKADASEFSGGRAAESSANASATNATSELSASKPEAAPITSGDDFSFDAFTGTHNASPGSLSDILPGLRDYANDDPQGIEVANPAPATVGDPANGTTFNDLLHSIDDSAAAGDGAPASGTTFDDVNFDFEMTNAGEMGGQQSEAEPNDILTFSFD